MTPSAWRDRLLAPRGLAALAALPVGWYVGMAAYHVHRVSIDMEVYRAGGGYLLSDPAQLYTFKIIDLLPFTYPPFAAMVFAPLAQIPIETAALIVALLSAFALARIIAIGAELAGRDIAAGLPPSAARVASTLAARWGSLPWWLQGPLILGVLQWASVWAVDLEPVAETFRFGQINLVLCWLILVDLAAPSDRRWRGMLVGLATGLKLTPGIFLLFFLLTRQWRAARTAAATTLATIVLGFVVVPGAAVQFWFHALLDSSRVGVLSFVSNQSLNGALARVFVEPPKVLWLLLAVVVGSAAAYLARRLYDANLRQGAALAAALCAVLVSPISWTHHWVWVVPLLILMAASVGGSLLVAAQPAGVIRRLAAVDWVAGALVWVWARLLREHYVWRYPHREGIELTLPLEQKLAQDVYVLLGLASLAWLALWWWRCSVRGGGATACAAAPAARCDPAPSSGPTSPDPA